MRTKCPDCCYPEMFDTDACGCCEGIVAVTPLSTVNRPGLSKLRYRIGTHAGFLETMLARLSSRDFPELAGLTTRESADPSIAMLDAWATVADVLTFYQERIANEGYLGTATERRSVLELARLVGYKLRPGVASSVFLAFTLDDKLEDEVTIPAGSLAQSIPGPDELPQSFETSEDLKARAKWNNLRPRMTRPQTEASISNEYRVYLKGINTNLKANDPLLIDLNGRDKPEFFRVEQVTPDQDADRTLITLQNERSAGSDQGTTVLGSQVQLIKDLTLSPSVQPVNTYTLKRSLAGQYMDKAESGYSVVKRFSPVLSDTLSHASANAEIAPASKIKVYALRLSASLFGYNAPKRTCIEKDGSIRIIGDWPIVERGNIHETETTIYLNAHYDGIQAGNWVVVNTPATRLTDSKRIIVRASAVDNSIQRSEYGVTGSTTRIDIEEKWITLEGMLPSEATGDDFSAIRGTKVYTQPVELELAEEPIEEPVCGGTNDPLEMDGFYEGLESGRWVIVSGERDIPGTSGVRFNELAMLASVYTGRFQSSERCNRE